MNISIFGLRYVSAVSLACLARDKHRITRIDIDETKLAQIASNKTPVLEKSMIELIAKVVASDRILVTNNAREAIHYSGVSFICVNTPSAPNESQDQSALLRLARELGTAMRDKHSSHVFV